MVGRIGSDKSTREPVTSRSILSSSEIVGVDEREKKLAKDCTTGIFCKRSRKRVLRRNGRESMGRIT